MEATRLLESPLCFRLWVGSGLILFDVAARLPGCEAVTTHARVSVRSRLRPLNHQHVNIPVNPHFPSSGHRQTRVPTVVDRWLPANGGMHLGFDSAGTCVFIQEISQHVQHLTDCWRMELKQTN